MIKQRKIALSAALVIGFTMIFIIAYSNLSQEAEPKTAINETISTEENISESNSQTEDTLELEPKAITPQDNQILLSESLYVTPDGSEPIMVKIEVDADQKISSIDVSLEGLDSHSQYHQDIFMKSFDRLNLVGKTIEEAEMDKVASASLTSTAYNKAIAELSDQIS